MKPVDIQQYSQQSTILSFPSRSLGTSVQTNRSLGTSVPTACYEPKFYFLDFAPEIDEVNLQLRNERTGAEKSESL